MLGMKPKPLEPTPIRLGAITLRQVGERVLVQHRSKAGHVVEVEADAQALRRWAMRVLRQEAFA